MTAAIAAHALHNKQNGGRVLRLTKALLADERCADVTTELRTAAATLASAPTG